MKKPKAILIIAPEAPITREEYEDFKKRKRNSPQLHDGSIKSISQLHKRAEGIIPPPSPAVEMESFTTASKRILQLNNDKCGEKFLVLETFRYFCRKNKDYDYKCK